MAAFQEMYDIQEENTERAQNIQTSDTGLRQPTRDLLPGQLEMSLYIPTMSYITSPH